MPNKKGGYKIVSLKNINLLGESLNLAGLYKALNDSYGKPIQLCDIKFGTVAKKDAFVLVEKLDAGVKINDLYGYDILVESDDDITVTANPQELPDTASATAGQILGLNAQKKPEWQDKPASGTKLYKIHVPLGTNSGDTYGIELVSTQNSKTPTSAWLLGKFWTFPADVPSIDSIISSIIAFSYGQQSGFGVYYVDTTDNSIKHTVLVPTSVDDITVTAL